jgi:ABC-type transport system substrate-binding protein
MEKTTLTRRTVLRTATLATTALAKPFVSSTRAAAAIVPKGKIVLAWHTNITARWLDPQQHDGTASPDNFLMALQDALIKNFREMHYDQPALAEGFDLAEDAKSATFRLRRGIKFHDGTPVTPADVKWSYEHYRGAWGEVLHENRTDT